QIPRDRGDRPEAPARRTRLSRRVARRFHGDGRELCRTAVRGRALESADGAKPGRVEQQRRSHMKRTFWLGLALGFSIIATAAAQRAPEQILARAAMPHTS